MPNRFPEPLAWLAFSAGGVAAAIFAPVLLFLFGLALPLGLISPPDHAHLLGVLGHPLSRIVLLGAFVAALFHFAHRFRYTLYDGLQLGRYAKVINVGCYGVALVGSAAAAAVLLLA
jgi:fumarate reductase subunit D